MERNMKKATGWDARVRGELRKFFEFYALLATLFSLRLWLVTLRVGRRYAPTRVTVLTALTIHLFKVEKCFVAFLRVSQRAFWPKCFLCYLASFSAIQKIFSCCFTLLLFFILVGRQRARRAVEAGPFFSHHQGYCSRSSTVQPPHPCGLSCGASLVGRRPPPGLCIGSPVTGCFHGSG